MKASAHRLNPFVLMLDPEAVISAMEDSADLRRLRQRVCRPLDKPLIPKTHAVAADFDAVIDASADEPLPADTAVDAATFMDGGTAPYVSAQPALTAVH